jgi:hypothetical protein
VSVCVYLFLHERVVRVGVGVCWCQFVCVYVCVCVCVCACVCGCVRSPDVVCCEVDDRHWVWFA